MTHSYTWHDSRLIPIRNAHINTSCHTHECVMSHTWMRHVTHMNASRHTYTCFTTHTWMRHATHTNASCRTYKCVMSHAWMRHVLTQQVKILNRQHATIFELQHLFIICTIQWDCTLLDIIRLTSRELATKQLSFYFWILKIIKLTCKLSEILTHWRATKMFLFDF